MCADQIYKYGCFEPECIIQDGLRVFFTLMISCLQQSLRHFLDAADSEAIFERSESSLERTRASTEVFTSFEYERRSFDQGL